MSALDRMIVLFRRSDWVLDEDQMNLDWGSVFHKVLNIGGYQYILHVFYCILRCMTRDNMRYTE